MAFYVPNPYGQAIRGGLAVTHTARATLGGDSVLGADLLYPLGGTVTDTIKPGVRRVLSMDLSGAADLYNLLSPAGTMMSVTAHVQYTNRVVVDIPMGLFSVDAQTLSEGDGKITVTAPDKWALIQRAKFTSPQNSTKTLTVTQQIAALIRGALGALEPVNITATSTAVVGVQAWPSDRAQAIIDLANGIGAWVYFDRYGVATVADLPQIGTSADWLVDVSPQGVAVSLDRSRDRSRTYNVVRVASSNSAGPSFAPQTVWDSDPNSPTYAGTDPINHPELAGPFGVVTYAFDTPLPMNAAAAARTGRTILAKVVGLASSINATQVPNPAVDAGDVIDVLPLPALSGSRALERHAVDTVTHSLDPTAAQQIQGRSTRTDPYT